MVTAGSAIRWSRRLLGGALLGALAGCATPPPVATVTLVNPAVAEPAAVAALAPTGVLRVGVYEGSPSSYVQGTPDEPTRGVGYLVGLALAEKLGVLFEPVVFARNAEVQTAAEQGRIDLVFTNATPERARGIDFSPTVLEVQKSVLVPAGSPIASLDALRGRAVRIGVSVGSSTGEELKAVYPDAVLQDVPTLQQAARLLAEGRLDGFATNDAILFELADRVPGSQVLPGSWGLEHFALGVPKGRGAAGREYLARFAGASQAGLLPHAVEASHLRGTVAPVP